MINFSLKVSQDKNGNRADAASYPTTQIDIERLISFANNRLNINYRYIPTSLANGDYPVIASISGVQSPSTTLITVQP